MSDTAPKHTKNCVTCHLQFSFHFIQCKYKIIGIKYSKINYIPVLKCFSSSTPGYQHSAVRYYAWTNVVLFLDTVNVVNVTITNNLINFRLKPFLKVQRMLFITTKHNMRKTTVKQELDKEKWDIAHLSALGSAVWFCCSPSPPPTFLYSS